MKKIILFMFLLVGVLGFSRFIEECEITSVGTYSNGTGYMNCISLSTGQSFNFKGVSRADRASLYVGGVFKIYFEGLGYRSLYLSGYEYLY